MLTYLGFACPEFLSAVYNFEIFSSCLVVGAMKNQKHLLSVPVSHSSDCLESLLPRASEATVTHFPTPSNFSSPSPSTTPHFPPPLPLPGNSLAVARQRPSCLPLFSSTCFTCPLDLSRPSSFPHFFFPSLPYGFYPPPPLLPLPRCHLIPGTCCAMKCPLFLHTPPPPRYHSITVRVISSLF